MSLSLQGVEVQLGTRVLQASHDFAAARTALFGRSGAGKTALLETIAGLRRPRAGRIELDGVAVSDVSRRIDLPARLRGVGYVPQDVALFPHLSVRDNLLYGAHGARNGAGNATERLTLAHVAAVLEIAPLFERAPSSLSGGEKQRVAVGRALLARPRVLLLDEPLASLDGALKERTLALIGRVHAEFGVPMLYVTHAPEEVVALCDAVVVLDGDRIARAGRPMDLFESTAVAQLRLRPPSAQA